MRCEVVRETLSALLDGEQQQVPAQRIDSHLAGCRHCRSWLVGAAAQARRLAVIDSRLDTGLDTGVDTGHDTGQSPDLAERILAAAGVTVIPRQRRWLWLVTTGYRRAGLIGVGMFQVAVALAQIGGVDFGMVSAHGHGAATGAHLLHESTAWLVALGAAMIAAGVWPAIAAGVAAIAGVFTLVLLGYVAVDAYSGQVTGARIASHLPVLVGLVFALLVARQRAGSRGSPTLDVEPVGEVSHRAGARRARRSHLRPVNRSRLPAAATTTGRRVIGSSSSSSLRWVMMAGAGTGNDDDAVTALALAAARGNAAALEAFIKATQRDVWRFVAYLSDGANADDLTQETFLRAIGAVSRFSGRSSARTWLLAIARRVVADHIRYLQSRPRAAHGADPEQLLNRDRPARGFEDLVEVTTMIAHLSSDQREALLLTQLLGMSYRDAAAVCGCPVGTIRSRVARARDALLVDADRDELTG